jgi:hypothetical protein
MTNQVRRNYLAGFKREAVRHSVPVEQSEEPLDSGIEGMTCDSRPVGFWAISEHYQ